MSLLARLKPFNERKGHLARTYTIDGNRFFVERGWYEVPDDLGLKLRDLHQDHYNPDSPFLFDVCTPSQAQALDDKENAVVETKASARRPARIERSRSGERLPINNAGEGEGGDTTTGDVARRPQPSGERLPINNAGEGEGGDTTTGDVAARPAMLDPDPDGKELDEDDDEGRALEVGRVGGASMGRSTPPKTRIKK